MPFIWKYHGWLYLPLILLFIKISYKYYSLLLFYLFSGYIFCTSKCAKRNSYGTFDEVERATCVYVLKLAAVKSRPAGRETIRRARMTRLCEENLFFFSLYIACFRIMDQRLFGDDSRTGLSFHCHFKNTYVIF